jgi:methylated-DNA-[protein]-cysteine S-methyltransferase
MYTLILFETAPGWMGVVGSEKGLKKVILPQKSRDLVLSQADYDFVLSRDFSSTCLGDLPASLIRYMDGEKAEFPDRIDWNGFTAFQKNVWERARRIPYGESSSYSRLADEIGCASGARAVGNALGRNPVPIIVPCHRVLRKDGALGGFSAGLDMKKHLLRLEGLLN